LDGQKDLVQISILGGQGWVGLASSTGAFNLWSKTFYTGEANGAYRHYFEDVNGDGKEDLVQISIKGGQGWVALADANGSLALWTNTFSTGEVKGLYRHHFADVNGDGKTDLVQFSRPGGSGWVGLANLNNTFKIWSANIGTGEYGN